MILHTLKTKISASCLQLSEVSSYKCMLIMWSFDDIHMFEFV